MAAVGVVVLADDAEDVFDVEGVEVREVFVPKPLTVVEPEKEGRDGGRAWGCFGVNERGGGPEESGDLSVRGLTPASAREDFRRTDLVGVAIELVLLGVLLVDGVGVETVESEVESPAAAAADGFLLAGGEGEEEPSELLPLPPRRDEPRVGRSPL